MNQNNHMDNQLLTKKGTIRKRAPKKKIEYFTEETEDAILQYVESTNEDEKNKIYDEKIKNAFSSTSKYLKGLAAKQPILKGLSYFDGSSYGKNEYDKFRRTAQDTNQQVLSFVTELFSS